MATFKYYLEQTFKDKTTPKESVEYKRMMKAGKNVTKFLNPRETSIYLGVTIDGKYIKIKLDEKIRPEDWDFKNQRVKTSHPTSLEFNTDLSALKSEAEKKYRNLMDSGKKVTIHLVKDVLQKVVKQVLPDVKSDSFFEVFDQIMESSKLTWKPNNRKKYTTLRGQLKDFENFDGKILFEKMDDLFMERWQNHLVSKGLLTNTVAKYLATLKSFLRIAMKQDYYINLKALDTKIKYDACDIHYLTSEEVERIKALDLSHSKGLSESRDVFLFQLFTGQRYGDVKCLRYENLVKNGDRFDWHLYQIKSNKSRKLIIPLLNYAMEIVKKYLPGELDNISEFSKRFVVPAPSDPVMNRRLKIIGQLAKLNEIIVTVKYNGKRRIEQAKQKWQLLTTHLARKSFVTTSMELGLRPEVIQSITGHEDYRVMKRYLAITDKVKQQEFFKAWENNK
jgi:site-specific recombinase XerD